MKRILACMFSLFGMIVILRGNADSGNAGYPTWVNELHSEIDRAFHIQASLSLCKEPDYIGQGTYFSFCLQGNGQLARVPDPFREMEKLLISQGWEPDERYRADGHGSSSFAYTKQNHLCLVSLAIDSSCDDEEEGHVPSEFWLSMYCREKDGASGAAP